MPYIGASNHSKDSFQSLKEKHSISNSKNTKNTTPTLSEPYDTVLSPSSDQTSCSSSSVSRLSTPIKQLSLNQSYQYTSSQRRPSTSSKRFSVNSNSSTVSDMIDFQELYNIPNESTHSYSYNPLSPNSLAVRLSILKRALQILLSNPSMLTNPSNNDLKDNFDLDFNNNIPYTSDGTMSINSNHNINNEIDPLHAFDPHTRRTVRSQSLSNAKNSYKNQVHKFTLPTAALNAFVVNTTTTLPTRKNSDITTTLTNRTARDIDITHRANSVAVLPKILNEYNFDYSNPNFRHTSNHTNNNNRDRTPFRRSFQSNMPAAKEQEEEKEQEEDFLEEQRSNLISLLDLLNETLEKNASADASHLHMLSLFNINKLILDKDEDTGLSSIEKERERQATLVQRKGIFIENSTEGTDKITKPSISKKKRNSSDLKLKKILLDSLAEPFFDRSVSYEETLLSDEGALQKGLDDFIKIQENQTNDSVTNNNSASTSKKDYGKILKTFTSAKNSAPQAIFTCSQDHPWKFKAANDLTCLIFGINKNVLKTLTLLDLIHVDSRDFVIHKIVSTENQELVFAGEIIGIVQPRDDSDMNMKDECIWASFWAKRKNGLLVCIFEKVPCDYVDILMDVHTFDITNVIKRNDAIINNDLFIKPKNANIQRQTPKFELGPSKSEKKDEGYSDDTASEAEDTDIEIQKRSISNPETKYVELNKHSHNIAAISKSLAKFIDNIRDESSQNSADNSFLLAERISKLVNMQRYFTLNHAFSNIPCAISSVLLEDKLKLKIHCLPYIAGLLVVDSHSLQMVSCNKSISKNMFGYHFIDLVNKPITTIIPSFQNIIDFISSKYPDLDITLPENKGMVLTEHFFRKIVAEMKNDRELFYTSVGIDAIHHDGNVIKIDFQLRVVNPNVCLVWVTHSRDVIFEDYKTTPSQLVMLKENELAYLSSSTNSSRSSSQKSSSKASLDEMSMTPRTNNNGSPITKPTLREVNVKNIENSLKLRKYSDETKSNYVVTNRSAEESTTSFNVGLNEKENVATDIDEIGTNVEDPETKHKLELARIYAKDKTQFVKKDNFKVDRNLIISKISSNIITESSSDHSDEESGRTATTFLRTPSKEIGSLKHVKKLQDFIILQKMGEGAYGKVNLCMHKMKKYIVVIKMIFKERILVDTWVRDRKLGTIPSEIQIMATLNKKPHENILRLLDFFEDDEYYYIETPVHGETGSIDLFDLIEFTSNMTEFEIKLLFKQVVSGVKHLHDQGIVHRDIKDENIIVDNKGFIKIIDFGSAAYVKSGPFDVFVGTIDYAAPEVLGGNPYEGKPQDIWALGILLYTIVFKENPFYNIDEILEGDLKFNDPENISQDCIELIKLILNRNVFKRPTIDDIYNDKWLDI
ncbi:hypothetical protein KAFR_0K00700 [Kazachstania africana CBS 2517]|uniref:non-specific serine/threonine protein kinase n=1 Tax=Kazachstania africana (strain ATCC 22294 / BCRC 22015 / CBS 2517 / CECT 1963 / NBRC 1671 / NRRL Y-8276) TaxID=1071382 RepID=H2B1C5_KAZAF|nr:hypothetical protein KAFR_0K00700 [Kazachstania africana CBS 2517]CCF60425.1 hypothetical protein KAFR_0K00700 [Kazachstania africana CBS 2517]